MRDGVAFDIRDAVETTLFDPLGSCFMKVSIVKEGRTDRRLSVEFWESVPPAPPIPEPKPAPPFNTYGVLLLDGTRVCVYADRLEVCDPETRFFWCDKFAAMFNTADIKAILVERRGEGL